jgi:hypothetical protein
VRSISNPPADVSLGGGFEIDVIKTKHTCRFGESGIGRTSGGWKFPELGSSGNFQPPSVRPIPDSPNLQVYMFVIEPYKFPCKQIEPAKFAYCSEFFLYRPEFVLSIWKMIKKSTPKFERNLHRNSKETYRQIYLPRDSNHPSQNWWCLSSVYRHLKNIVCQENIHQLNIECHL